MTSTKLAWLTLLPRKTPHGLGFRVAGNTSEPGGNCKAADVRVGSGVAGSRRNRVVATGVADAGAGRNTTTGRRMPQAGVAFEPVACFRCWGQSFV